MIAALLLLQAAAATPAQEPPAPPAALAVPPADLDALPQIALVRRWPDDADLSAFVRAEMRAGRCSAPVRTADGYRLDIDIAVFVSAGGQVRRLIPRAIGCVGVEQYAAGLASRMVRGNVAAPGADTWYRLPIAFRWRS